MHFLLWQKLHWQQHLPFSFKAIAPSFTKGQGQQVNKLAAFPRLSVAHIYL